MTTINPSNAADDAGANSAMEVEAASKPGETTTAETGKKIPLAFIPATISIGLLIALLYLGGRIITAQRTAKPAIVKSSSVVAKPVELKAIQVKPADIKPADVKPVAVTEPVKTAVLPVATLADQSPQSEDDALPTITPQTGQRYIQVGALELSAEATRRFVTRLRGEKLDPHVAPGPSPALMRVLIGPFENLDALNEKKAQLDAEGVDSFVRKY
jgi:cell division septation protein DedD